MNRGYEVRKDGKYKEVGNNSTINYYALGVIGTGSFGIVYIARNEHNQVVAVKCKKRLNDRETMTKSTMLFRGELEALYNLQHANILKLIGAEFKNKEVVSLVMEYIPGETLDKIIRCYRSLSESTIQLYMKQIMDAVFYMHSNYVMHRDMKSSNIMVISNKWIKLIDFGMAKHFDFSDTSIIDPEMVASTVVGTMPYMCPELINFSSYNSKADIWSIGVIMFEMHTGDVFMRYNRMYGGMDTIPLSVYPNTVNCPGLSQTANSFLKNCLVKQPDYRPTAEYLVQHPFLKNVNNVEITQPTNFNQEYQVIHENSPY